VRRALLYNWLRWLFLLGSGLLALTASAAQTPPDLSEYRTAKTAVTAKVAPAAAPGQTGYLGVRLAADPGGRLVVAEVQPESPGARAGLQSGDVVVRVAGQPVSRAEVFREMLQMRPPGEKVVLAILRKDQPLEVTATLAATSRPMKPAAQRGATFGARLGEPASGDGAAVEQVLPRSPAASAGLREGDLIVKVNGSPLKGSARFNELLLERRPGDTLTLGIRRDGKEIEVKVQLSGDRGPSGRFGFRDSAPPAPWKKSLYRLAVIGVEFPDVKHNAKVPGKEWQEALFSRTTYVNKNSATGQAVYGSVNDYFHEQSCGAFRVEGKVFDWVEVGKKRSDYSQGSGTSNRTVPLVEALDKLLARDGKDALKGFDGLCFFYAGDAVRTNRGGLYYPHTGSLTHQGQRWSYMLVPEGGSRMTPLSVLCRQFASLLGLPDLAARPENPGSEGAGVWCLMSEPIDGRPQHLCAWSKEQLGWLKPVVIDPTVKQKLILAPLEESPHECLKVLVRPDGSEYLLLENRRKKGFDQSLPAEGLLIWRVVNNRPVLEESHGIEGSAGPRALPEAVPYPSAANNAFTPYTTPSSRSPRGGGLPVHITEIRRLADGRIALHIGYEYH
jgi:M6 family metalloprotease-like protein